MARANIADLWSTLRIDMAPFAEGLDHAARAADDFAKSLSDKIDTGITNPLKKSKFEFKDVARIVQGIIISKIFYGGMNAIRRATDSVWEFSKSLEYASMVYTNLFGDKPLAEEFINVLKDFAAVTPFTFTQAEAAAKRLLAYGIEAKNVMFVMQGVLAAGTVQGDERVVESISRALGQIYTKGRLMNEEMRQLAEAGIPAYEILRDKLNLTQKELQNLGDHAIPANTAINALVEGINERFGPVIAQSSRTMQGIISNIKDNASMLAAGLADPFVENAKRLIERLGTFTHELRNVFETGGAGAVFERLIPPGLQDSVRVFIHYIKILWDLIKTNLASAFSILRALIETTIKAFNAVAPVILNVVAASTVLTRAIANNSTAMRVITTLILMAATAWTAYKVRAIVAAATTTLINVLRNSIRNLTRALDFLVEHPIWFLIIIATVSLVSLTNTSDKFRKSIDSLFASFRSLTGLNTTDILMPESKDRAADLSKFNQALEMTSEGIKGVADEAKKAAKGLLGFDEVFSLTKPGGTGEVAGMFDVGDIDFTGIDFSDIKMPEVSGITESFVDNFSEAMGGAEPLVAAGIGSVLLGALGLLLTGGNPIGAKIGMAIGGFGGFVWDDIAKELGMGDIGKVAVPLGTIISTAIGFLAGGPVGAAIGAAIGLFATWLVDIFVENWDTIKGWFSGAWEWLKQAAIDVGDWFKRAGSDIWEFLKRIHGTALTWIRGAWEDVKQWLVTAWGNVVDWVKGAAEDVWEWIKTVHNTALEWLKGAWESIVEWFKGAWEDIKAFFVRAYEGFIEDMTWLWETVSEWFQKIWGVVSEKVISIWETVSTWFQKMIGTVSDKLSSVWTSVSEWFQKIWGTVSDKAISIWETVATWFQKMIGTVSEKLSGVWSSVSGWFQSIWDTVAEKVTGLYESVTGGIKDIYNEFVGWISDLWNNVFGKLFGWLDTGISKIGEFFSAGAGKIGNLFGINPVASPNITRGHATGGIFNKEHVARFAEGNKAEAIIPLENEEAMRPFVDAVSNGLSSALMPIIANMSGGQQSQLQPLYVGTLIADERGLKELSRKMDVIQLEERARRG